MSNSTDFNSKVFLEGYMQYNGLYVFEEPERPHPYHNGREDVPLEAFNVLANQGFDPIKHPVPWDFLCQNPDHAELVNKALEFNNKWQKQFSENTILTHNINELESIKLGFNHNVSGTQDFNILSPNQDVEHNDIS